MNPPTSRQDSNDRPAFAPVRPPPRLLSYGRPETPMPAAIQWLLGVPLGLVVVTVVGAAGTLSRGPLPGILAALVSFGVLGLWIGRLRREGYYGAMAAAVCSGGAAAIAVVVSFIASINWG